MNNTVLDEFWTLCREATLSWEEEYGTRFYEQHLLNALLHVKSYPEYRYEFVQCFIKLINDPDLGIWEIVQFCMRDLRWLEVYDAAKKRFAESEDFRVKHVMEDIMSAYSDNWKGCDIWEFYSKRGKK